MGDWTNITIRKQTKKELTELKGLMEAIDGKDYTYDEVISRLTNSLMIQFRKKVNSIGDELIQ